MSSQFFSFADLATIYPELLVAAMSMILLVLDVFVPKGRKALLGAGVIATCVGAGVLLFTIDSEKLVFSNLFSIDSFGSFFKVIFLLSTVLVVLISTRFLDLEESHLGEYYVLLLIALLGMMFMASSVDLIAIYVSLETMAITCYVLAGFFKRDRRSNEAGMKYFLLGAFASGILLYGMALLYGMTGTTNLLEIASKLQATGGDRSIVLLGMLLLIAGLSFKIAAVPFHMWAPDIYQGAPTPVTAFLSVAPKAAYFAIVARIFLIGLDPLAADWATVLAWISFFTMTAGNVGAIVQTNVKRLLAYSSISHAGYLLIGIVARGDFGLSGLMIYLFIYVFMNIGAFAVVIYLRSRSVEGDEIEHFKGLAQHNPWAAALMVIFLLSLAGIPPTAGFIGKYFLFSAAIDQGWALLAVAGVVNSAISLYYYFKIVMAMYMGEPSREPAAFNESLPLVLALVLTVSATLAFGLYPAPLIELARASTMLVP